MCMNNNIFKYSSAFFTLLLFCSFLQAQVVSSPYSRYGIGDIGNKGFGQNLAMGGTSIAIQNDTSAMFFINSNNPASFSNFRLTTIEIGANVSLTQLQSTSTKQSVNNASLNYISMAIPLKKWWGASVGLMPYSSVGYKVADQQNISGVGDVKFVYEGSGGINQVYFGNGIKPFYGLKKAKNLKHLSIGANASYLFGSTDNVKRSVFDGTYFFNTRSGTTTRVADLYLDYGMQYAYNIDSINGRELKDKVKLFFGATFANETPIKATIDSLTYNYFLSSQNLEFGKDTVQNVQNVKGEIIFPRSIGFGFGIKKGDKLLVTADYRMQNWSSYKAFDKSQKLKNGSSLSVGIQYTPNAKSNGKGAYLKRVNYRGGFRYVQTPLELKNTALNEYSVTMGFGLPVGRSVVLQNFSMLNIGLELGQRGTSTNGLIKEQFIKCNIGVTINDKWFRKNQFD